MKVLVVYNTCGIKRDSPEWYVKCLQSILKQATEVEYRVLWSSCLNSPNCFEKVYSVFKDKISYCYHDEPHTVNITFNKSVQEATKHFGDFTHYVYIDSGVILDDETTLNKMFNELEDTSCGMLTVQTDTDEALNAIDDKKYVYQSSTPQIVGENVTVPVGKACNVHLHSYSRELYDLYKSKLIPDVFAAYCTESTFSFLTAAANQFWVIMKDHQVRHLKSVDGASACVPHTSQKFSNPWNNLLYDRNALDFINDEEAYLCGLGYEECGKIMMHNPEAYDEEDRAINPNKLAAMINKYFFLTDEELDYENIKHKFIP